MAVRMDTTTQALLNSPTAAQPQKTSAKDKAKKALACVSYYLTCQCCCNKKPNNFQRLDESPVVELSSRTSRLSLPRHQSMENAPAEIELPSPVNASPAAENNDLEVAALRAENARLRALQAQFDLLPLSAQQLMQANIQLAQANSDRETDLRHTRHSVNTLSVQLKETNAELETAKAQLKARTDDLESLQRTSRESSAGDTAEIADLKKKLASLTRTSDGNAASLTDERERNRRLEKRVLILSEQRETLETNSKSEKAALIKARDADIASLQEQLIYNTRDLERAAARREEELIDQIRERDTIIADLEPYKEIVNQLHAQATEAGLTAADGTMKMDESSDQSLDNAGVGNEEEMQPVEGLDLTQGVQMSESSDLDNLDRANARADQLLLALNLLMATEVSSSSSESAGQVSTDDHKTS